MFQILATDAIVLFTLVGANRSTTLWGFTQMTRPEGPKSEARRAERGEVLGEGMFPSLLARESGGATWRFETFYRLTKPFLVSILLTLNSFQLNFRRVRATRRDPTTKFLWRSGHPADRRLCSCCAYVERLLSFTSHQSTCSNASHVVPP